jgi:hypothetical protein
MSLNFVTVILRRGVPAVIEGNIKTCEWRAFSLERSQRICAEKRSGLVEIEHVNDDWPLQQVGLTPVQQEQRVHAVDRGSAADIDQMQRRGGVVCEMCNKSIGDQSRHLLRSKPQQSKMRRRRHTQVDRSVVRRRQIVGAKLDATYLDSLSTYVMRR